MVDEAGWNVSVTEERYLNMWKNEVWPIVGRNGYWEMQGDVTSDTTMSHCMAQHKLSGLIHQPQGRGRVAPLQPQPQPP